MVSVDLWPACGYRHLYVGPRGWLEARDDWWRGLLGRPELAPVAESCRAERALHARLLEQPTRPVDDAALARLRDADARENVGHFLAFRDAVVAAGSLEGWLLQLLRGGNIGVPPVFIDLVVQAVVRHLLDGSADALAWRAGELLFRAQRLTRHEGRLLAGDRDTLDLQNETQGLGELGRLLAQAQVPLKRLELQTLGADNAADYFARAAQPGGGGFLLDLTHQIQRDLGHGVQFTLANARSGLGALAGVLERWVQHLLGVAVHIEPRRRIDDDAWRWHLGLDVEASRLLDDLYHGNEVEASRLERLISLFELRFDDPAEMRADVAGRPVYLGLMATPDWTLRLKPQNLLLNLPLASAS